MTTESIVLLLALLGTAVVVLIFVLFVVDSRARVDRYLRGDPEDKALATLTKRSEVPPKPEA